VCVMQHLWDGFTLMVSSCTMRAHSSRSGCRRGNIAINWPNTEEDRAFYSGCQSGPHRGHLQRQRPHTEGVLRDQRSMTMTDL
jgi:hypothetical protein